MKKLFTLIFLAICIIPSAFAEDLVENAPVPELISVETTSVENIDTQIDIPVENIEITNTQAVENIQAVQSEVAQEDIQYNYYHSDTCGWCQKLDSFLKKNDGYDKLNINKVNVTRNGIPMIAAAEEHNVDPSTVGTPFVTYGPNGTGSVVTTGYYGAVELFADALGVDANVGPTETDPMQKLIIILVGLIVIVGPLAYLGLKK